ncbi:PilN domain-containing protein [Aromatoleum toluclasticum]|uniref:PilN domain-containing protein n=1 Tax=Aromatoleum toluclasticum TaxID=92003 RepID=UPI00036D151D|nr:PilN domain-containing protein [Aromatoleum toluclasticum]
MNRLELDFRRPPKPRAGGWVLLAAGIALVGTAMSAGLRVDAEAAALETIVRDIVAGLPEALLDQHPPGAGVKGGGKAGASGAGKERDNALADMQRVQARIDNRPWQALFATLESLASDDVALLSLTPDARKGQLRITAEARDLGAMLAYHRKLEDTAVLRDVSLVNHEFAEQVQGRPVRFSLVASWVTDHAAP